MARRLGMLFLALAVPACFDVRRVDPGPCGALSIDDFEDGDQLPTLRQLGPWQCQTFNPPVQDIACDLEPGHGDSFALFTKFELHDPMDGRNQNGAAFVGTVASAGTLDLTGYQQFVFSARIESGGLTLPSGAGLSVDIGCLTAPVDNPSVGGYVFVTRTVPILIDSDWSTFMLALANFGEPSWETNHVIGGPRECLARVDRIGFTVISDLTDGQSASGSLHIDDVYLNSACRTDGAPD